MKRPMLWTSVLLASALFGLGWCFAVRNVDSIGNGMTLEQVEQVMGRSADGCLGEWRGWDNDTGAIWVKFDGHGRVNDVVVFTFPMGPSLWETWTAWLRGRMGL